AAVMRRRRGLSGDELDLWRRATRDVDPLAPRPAARRAPDGAVRRVADEPPTDRSRAPRGAAGAHKRPAAPNENPKAYRPTGAALSATPDAVGAGDPRADRRVRRGATAIERRLDLHGMTQAAAEAALRRFLAAAARDGCRCVLVITGKGAGPIRRYDGAGLSPHGPAGDPFRARRHGADGGGVDDFHPAWAPQGDRGVIRRRFRDWVNAPALRGKIARVAPAARADGGDGAWYVFLKSPAARPAR
ncbi:MAG: Smr/MutS family protein, partial [Pseudomonadota bacterium]